MKFCFICTNFNTSSFTIDAIRSLEKNKGHEINIVVVDNNSSEEQKLILSNNLDHLPNVLIYFSKINLGYFRGLNKGIEISRTLGNFDIIIVGNNDLLFPKDLFKNLTKHFDILIKYPVICPGIFTLDNVPQNPHVVHSISSFREIIYDIYHFSFLLSKLILNISRLTHSFTKRRDEIDNFDKKGEIWQGYGACYFLTKCFFEKVGDELWSPSFLLFEEFFLSKQLEDKGFKMYYLPEIKITHLTHSSTSLISSKTKWKFSKESFKIYRKHVKSPILNFLFKENE